MSKIEYKVEMIEWVDEKESHLDQLVERLNELGKDGWHVVSADITAHSSFETKKLPVLLEREAAVVAVR
jgi:Domain of unknown function (DUF4177)